MKRLPLCKEVHLVLWCQISRIQNLTDISNYLRDIISCLQIDLTLSACIQILTERFFRKVTQKYCGLATV